MAVLDTKSNRVTLKMDVSHTDHSHVIGKGGNNIKRVMQETSCHIHFPDSNRGNNVQEKSNQVSIAGQPNGVEAARIQIRNLLPLVFMFELPLTGQPLPDVSSPLIQQLQQQHNITINFRQRPRIYTSTVIVRGSVYNAKGVKEATSQLMDTLIGSIAHTPIAVSMQLEIAAQHHLFIIGRGGVNIKQIMQQTGAVIHFPDPNTVTPQRKGTVYITGTIDSVFLARQQLIGCLPLVLMFDVKDEIEMDQGRINKFMEQLDVYITVKPKMKQPSKSVIIKSIERNAGNMYLARLLLLGLESEARHLPRSPATPNAEHANKIGLSTMGFLNQSLLSINTSSSPVLLVNGHTSSSIVSSPHTSPCSSSPNHWVSQPPGIYSPMVIFPPGGTCSVHNSVDLLSKCNGLQKELSQNNAFIRVPTPLEHGGSPHSGNNSPSRSPCDSPLSFRGPQTTADIAGLSTTKNFGKIMNHEASPSNSGHTMDLLGLSQVANNTSSLSPSQSLFLNSSLDRASLHGSLSRVSLHNGDGLSEQMMDQEVPDKRAPGIERKLLNTTLLFSPPYSFNVDYEQKKLMANKAMQKKPFGESRIPTHVWSGLGFSKSMPEAAIRERLNQSQRFESPMTTTYENTADELLEIDRDPWKDMSQPPRNKPINPAPGEYPSPRKKYDYNLSGSHHLDEGSLSGSTSSIWSPKTDLAELFSSCGLGKYTDLFQQQEIDLATFLTLTDQDLRELGITTFGARRKMLLAIAELNKRKTLLLANPGSNNPFEDNTSSGLGLRNTRPDIVSMSGRW
ncbi:hypothetical protein CHS0354_030122 [Potamilus streckersoni]|uniref:SAM domain-containing protein n=1 Tax=Potamilus streckersoni TaxID=2493646 RepID=A0AAE0W5M1_9BIVA|nr:hypothetical protein CHS0354_030122 [Potamilus streckersoni]